MTDDEYTPEQRFDDWLCDRMVGRFHHFEKYTGWGVAAVHDELDDIIAEYRKRFNPWKDENDIPE